MNYRGVFFTEVPYWEGSPHGMSQLMTKRVMACANDKGADQPVHLRTLDIDPRVA